MLRCGHLWDSQPGAEHVVSTSGQNSGRTVPVTGLCAAYDTFWWTRGLQIMCAGPAVLSGTGRLLMLGIMYVVYVIIGITRT